MTKKVIGLAGKIACGKSSVSTLLKLYCGAQVICADEIAHGQLARPSVKNKIRQEFGNEVFDIRQNIDRAALGKIVFNDGRRMAALENIVQPEVFNIIEDKVEDSDENLIIIDCFTIVDTPLACLIDDLWVVGCSQQTQLKRLMQRNKLCVNEALAKIRAQDSLMDEFYADEFIANDRSKEELKARVLSMVKNPFTPVEEFKLSIPEPESSIWQISDT